MNSITVDGVSYPYCPDCGTYHVGRCQVVEVGRYPNGAVSRVVLGREPTKAPDDYPNGHICGVDCDLPVW